MIAPFLSFPQPRCGKCVDVNQIRGMTDEELAQMAVANPPGHRWSDAARIELESRNARRLVESIKHIEDFAASTEQSGERMEKSGKRMELATWIILFATAVRLVLAAVSVARGH